MDTAETEDTYNKEHYVEDHPPFTRPKLSVEIASDAVADERQETDRHVDAIDQRYEDVTEMPETPEQRGAKRRSKEQKYEDIEASESRIEGTNTQDNSSRKMKTRRTGVG